MAKKQAKKVAKDKTKARRPSAPKPTTPETAPAIAKPAAPSGLYADILKHVDIKPAEKEERNAFITRLLEGINGLDDQAFDKLPEAVQKWFNGAAEFFKEGKISEIKLDGDPFSAPAVPTPAAEEDKGQAKAAAPAPTPAPEKPAKRERKPKAADGGNGVGHANSMVTRIRVEVCKKPDIKIEDLTKRLNASGHDKLDVKYVESVMLRTKMVLDTKAAVDAGTLK